MADLELNPCPHCGRLPNQENYPDGIYTYFCGGRRGRSHPDLQTKWRPKSEAQAEWNAISSQVAEVKG